jgi:hypothetical protein
VIVSVSHSHPDKVIIIIIITVVTIITVVIVIIFLTITFETIFKFWRDANINLLAIHVSKEVSFVLDVEDVHLIVDNIVIDSGLVNS